MSVIAVVRVGTMSLVGNHPLGNADLCRLHKLGGLLSEVSRTSHDRRREFLSDLSLGEDL